jgi:NAD(P)-dependent dehydrogenase (short-subunit alcohol dehydrogenase family)/acyl carrier protein
VTPAGSGGGELAAAVHEVLGAAAEVAVPVDGTGDRGTLAERLAQAAREAGPVSGVVMLPADPQPEREPEPEPVASGTGVTGTLLVLVQALGDAGIDAALWCLTRGAVAVDGGDGAPDPGQAGIWGLGRVAALEHPRRWGGLVDLPAGAATQDLAGLPAVLAGAGDEDQVAIRAGRVWGRRLRPAPAPAAAGAAVPSAVRGTVLITGGTGALGGHVARWLARAGAEHLLLVSRSGPDAPGANELTAELTGLGPQVTITACDVADRDALAAVLAAIPEQYPLTGVVHTAGVAGRDAGLDSLSVAELAEVMAAKVAGAVNLDALTAGCELDLFIMFSSIAGVWGSGGQSAYGAANAALDALAERRRSRGLAGLSVAWGAWGGPGMATVEGAAGYLKRRGVTLMPPGSAVAALGLAVAAGDVAVTVAEVDWERFIPAFTARRPSPLLSELPQGGAVATETEERSGAGLAMSLREQLTPLPAAERSEMLLELVQSRVAAVLEYSDTREIRADRTFTDLGFDSLTAVELRSALSAVTGLSLAATLVFDYPTPAALADYLGAALLPDLAVNEVDETEARIREVLASIPVRQLRKAGLLDMLLRLAEPDANASPEPSGNGISLDEMDAESLLRLATGDPEN